MLAQSKSPCQLSDLQGLGHEHFPVSDSAHRTLSFKHCLHSKGPNFHLHVRRENIKKINFHFTQCLHRTLSPLAYPLFLRQACSQGKELPLRRLTAHDPPQVINPCLWLLHSYIRLPSDAGFLPEMLMVQGLGFCFWANATASSKAQGREVLKNKQCIWNSLQPRQVSAAASQQHCHFGSTSFWE